MSVQRGKDIRMFRSRDWQIQVTLLKFSSLKENMIERCFLNVSEYMFFYRSRDDIDTVRGTVERGYSMYRTPDDTSILLTLFSTDLSLPHSV